MWILLAPRCYVKYWLQQALWPIRKPGSQVSNLPLLYHFGPHVRDDPLTVSPIRPHSQSERITSFLSKWTLINKAEQSRWFRLGLIRYVRNENLSSLSQSVKTQIEDGKVVDGVQVKWRNSFTDGSEAEAKITGCTVPVQVGGFGLFAKERTSEWGRNKKGVSENTNYIPIK